MILESPAIARPSVFKYYKPSVRLSENNSVRRNRLLFAAFSLPNVEESDD
jgi:hypothetical protein